MLGTPCTAGLFTKQVQALAQLRTSTHQYTAHMRLTLAHEHSHTCPAPRPHVACPGPLAGPFCAAAAGPEGRCPAWLLNCGRHGGTWPAPPCCKKCKHTQLRQECKHTLLAPKAVHTLLQAMAEQASWDDHTMQTPPKCRGQHLHVELYVCTLQIQNKKTPRSGLH